VAAARAPAAAPAAAAARDWGGLRVRLVSLAVVLGAWELYGRFFLNPVVFTYPSAIAVAFVQLLRSGELSAAAGQSMLVLFVGWATGILAGIPAGLLMARYRLLERSLDTYVNALYATPIVALVPLIINWFGFTTLARIVIVFLFAVFPVLINTFQGVRTVEPSLIEVAKSFCSTESRLWADVVLPSALPYIVAGLRLAIGRALVGLVVAELFTAIAGFGGIIERSTSAIRYDRMMVPVVILMIIGVGLTEGLKAVERWLAPWGAKRS
jgi:ABC-type nitrate/sulfonate/bicarbonate transport system permease component